MGHESSRGLGGVGGSHGGYPQGSMAGGHYDAHGAESATKKKDNKGMLLAGAGGLAAGGIGGAMLANAMGN